MRSATGFRRRVAGTARGPAVRSRPRSSAVAWIALAGAAGAGCAAALPPPDATPDGRFEWSQARFDRAKYHDAIRGFRDFLFRDPVHTLADSARFLLAESYLRSGQELLAANEFQQLAITRPNSTLADDAQLGACRAYWAMSPKLPLDQENTRRAEEECTRLLEFFPRSPLISEARQIRLEARAKLAVKQLRTARWYADRGFFESAIIYLESIVDTYPEAPALPNVLALLHESYSRVGFRAEAQAVRERLLRDFPDTEQARRVRERGSSGEPG